MTDARLVIAFWKSIMFESVYYSRCRSMWMFSKAIFVSIDQGSALSRNIPLPSAAERRDYYYYREVLGNLKSHAAT